MPKGNKVTEDSFNAVKAMIKGGLTYNEISKVVGLSTFTIGNMKRANTFDEYKDIVYKSSPAYRKLQEIAQAEEQKAAEQTKEQDEKAAAVQQKIIIQASDFMLMEQRKMTELLEGISRKLAFIVEELSGPAKKEDEKSNDD